MKSLALAVLIAAAGFWYFQHDSALIESDVESRLAAQSEIDRAFEERRSSVQVRGRGIVSRVLPDDNRGSRHQRFILDLASGRTLLVAHNIDLAQRIAALEPGDTVEFFGEYEWNEKGGLIHWTHHDPENRHVGGWLKHEGNIYQ